MLLACAVGLAPAVRGDLGEPYEAEEEEAARLEGDVGGVREGIAGGGDEGPGGGGGIAKERRQCVAVCDGSKVEISQQGKDPEGEGEQGCECVARAHTFVSFPFHASTHDPADMHLFALPTEAVGRSSRRIVINGDELRAEKLAAGDLVKVSAEGTKEVSPGRGRA